MKNKKKRKFSIALADAWYCQCDMPRSSVRSLTLTLLAAKVNWKILNLINLKIKLNVSKTF